jgi:hypothetical protein
MRFACLLAITASLSVAGCATSRAGASGAPRGGETYSVAFRGDALPVRRVVAAPVDIVWAALPDAFADLGYHAGPSARSGERLYFTPAMLLHGLLYKGKRNSLYLDCGRTLTGLAADEYEITFAILARVSPRDDANTIVEILVDGTARDRTSSSNSVFCTGTGVIEAGLLRHLEERLRT